MSRLDSENSEAETTFGDAPFSATHPEDFDEETPVRVTDRAHFTVDHLPMGRRFTAWKASVASLFDIELQDDQPEEPFYGSIKAQSFGTMMTTRTRTSRTDWHRTERTIGRSGLDHYMIQVFSRGSMTFESRRSSGKLRPGNVIVYDLAEVVRTSRTDFTNNSIFIPRKMIAPFLRAPDEQHMRVLDDREPLVSVFRDHMMSLIRNGPRMSADQAIDIVPATMALATACLNASSLDEADEEQDGVGRPLLTLLKAHIEEHVTDRGLTTDRLARDFGLSRSKLYRLFEPLGGVASYIRERRLRYAMAELMAPDKASVPIYLIATDAGFGDETDFSRAFRRRFGFTPRDARKASQDMAFGREQDASDGLDRRYETWMRQLRV